MTKGVHLTIAFAITVVTRSMFHRLGGIFADNYENANNIINHLIGSLGLLDESFKLIPPLDLRKLHIPSTSFPVNLGAYILTSHKMNYLCILKSHVKGKF